MADEEITCRECRKIFTFTERERQRFEKRGFAPPRRCPQCRAARRAAEPLKTAAGRFEVICQNCKDRGSIAFEPKEGAIYLCEDCFKLLASARGVEGAGRRSVSEGGQKER